MVRTEQQKISPGPLLASELDELEREEFFRLKKVQGVKRRALERRPMRMLLGAPTLHTISSLSVFNIIYNIPQ